VRIHRLDLNGFKSFPDRTSVEFGRGISCVVGPNGCGKSNILDAIRWVVGEQSARALRGGEMMDVIFTGSAERPPVGFAEVTMTLSAAGGEPFPGEYGALAELQVGRRLHRSGASEYFINQIRCRRKDIADLFMDTGVGSNLYSFIEQGSVGRIVHATPEERRTLLEEAAGIRGYKVRREEASARLRATAAQLDRAADLAEEMSRRLRGLERQVVQAARFRRLRAIIRQRELLLALARYADLAADRRRLGQEHREARQRADSADREVRRRAAEVERLREALAEVEVVAAAGRDEVAEQERLLQQSEGEVSWGERRRGELERELERSGEEETDLLTRHAQAEHTLAVLRAEVLDLTAEHEASAAELVDRQRVLEDASLVLAEARRRAEAGEREAAAADAREETARARVATLEATLSTLREEGSEVPAEDPDAREADAIRAAEAHERAEAAVGEALRTLEEGLRAQEGDRTGAERAVAEAEERVAAEVARAEHESHTRGEETLAEATRAVGAQLAARADARDRAWEAVAQVRDRRVAAEDRLAVLTRRQRGLEGRISGLEGADVEQGDPTEGLPRLADLLEEGHDSEEAAATLGDRLTLPVVRREEEVLALAGEVGDRTLRVLWLRPDAEAAALPTGVAVVADLPAALAHHRATGGTAVVRGTGERVDVDGVVSLGDRGAIARAALRRREELAALRASLDTVRKEVQGLEETRSGLVDREALLRRSAEEAEADLREAEQRGREALETRSREIREASERDLRQRREEGSAARDVAREALAALRARQAVEAAEWRARLEEAREAAEGARSGWTAAVDRARAAVEAFRRTEVRRARVAAAEAELGEARDLLVALERTAPERRAVLETLRNGLREAAVSEATAREACSETTVQMAALAERLEAKRRAVEEQEARLREVSDRLRTLSDRRSELGAQRMVNEEALQQAASALEQAREACAAARDRLQGQRERLEGLRGTCRGLETSLGDLGTARDDAVGRANDLQVRVRAIQLDVESLRAQMEERYLVSLPGLLDRIDAHGSAVLESDPEVRDDLRVGGKLVRGVPDLEVRAAMLQDFDGIAALVDELGEDRRRLAAFGEVNLAAAEEYREVSRRHAELAEQRADLEESVARIRTAIAKMNRTCRQRFRDTFDRVSDNLSQVYPRLAGGGTARLSLTDEEDLLETGVDITVQPPGKRLQKLSLLSGGEKAIAAIALIVALFQVRPSPFCVLDEVDAPLDDANGRRFSQLLRDMADVVQFILITHNRKTMEYADTLYGITMPTPGVSRLVSVRLEA